MPLAPSSTNPKAPDSQVQIKDFPGLMSYPDPNDIPPGSAIHQRNMVSLRPGELRVRGGYKVVSFSFSR